MKKVAILVDWENLRKTLERACKKFKIPPDRFSYNNVDMLLRFIMSLLEENEEVYRIFFYVSEPPKEARWRSATYSIDMDEKYRKVYENAITFLENLRTKDLVSIRKGKLEFRGYNSQNKPLFTQKQVDMLIGLDMAHLSYLKLVDRVMVFSLDKDLIPALKIARVNGLQVIIPTYKGLREASPELQEHADFIRHVDLAEKLRNL